MGQAHASGDVYYVPNGSHWPAVGTLGLFTTMLGAAMTTSQHGPGAWVMTAGLICLVVMLFGWFGDVISESIRGMYNAQVDVSFRMGMVWFIFSEVMFFAAFFGALFYARHYSIPWLGGEGDGYGTNKLLWDSYTPAWPTAGPSNLGGPFETISAWGIPLLNTLLLLTSGLTLTISHWALKVGHRGSLLFWLGATILLGIVFLYFQGYEYHHAYSDLNLTMESGIYGSTFFMLTGFHGLHVTLGTIMLIVIWFRCLKGHFTKEQHFGFEATAWYWHFVDVVWLGLFVFVYVV